MREQLSPSLSIREPKDRPKELKLAEKTKLRQIEQEMFIERMDDADKIFRMQASEEKIIDILEKTEPASLEQKESVDILKNELLRLFRELQESIQYTKDILASQQIKKEMLAKKGKKPKFTEPAWAKKEGMLIDMSKLKDENQELEIYIWDVVSKWSALQELSKEFFLPSQEVERIKEKMESTEQEIDKLRKLRQEYRKMAKTPEENVPQLDKEEARLNQKIADLETQIEPQERLCPNLEESFLTEQAKLEILKNIAEIGKNIDDLKLPAIEPEKNLKEIFNITKEYALQSEEIGDTYRLVLKGAPRNWGEKMKRWVEGLKENDQTRNFAEFMEKLRLPRFASEAGMAGALILMAGYLLGGCTKVEHAKAGDEKTEEQLTPEQIADREAVVAKEAAEEEEERKEKDKERIIKETLYQGSIRHGRYDSDIGAIVVENWDLKLKLVSVDNLDENWTNQQVKSTLFQKIRKIENRYLTKNIGNISTLEKANEVAQKMNIELGKNITPEQLIKIVAVTTAELLEYDNNALSSNIDEVITKGKGYCGTYADLSEYIADELINEYNIPNIAIENIGSDKQNHVFNIAYVLDKNGNITATLFDPTWIDSETGIMKLDKLNALDWQHLQIFNQSNAEDMLSIIEHLEKPNIKGVDYDYISAAVATMQAIFKNTVSTGQNYQAVSERMLGIFSNYENDKNQLNIVYNFFWNELGWRIAEAEICEDADDAKRYYESAWYLYKLAEKKFPLSGKYKIGTLEAFEKLEEQFISRIPEEFKK